MGRPGRRAQGGGAEREERDRGTAIVGTLVGFTIFMLLLLLAVQTLVHLYATSTVSAATFDAAWAVATKPDDEVAEIPVAETQARQRMGRLGSSATFRWLEADGQQVALEVQVRSPGFLPFSTSLLEVQRTVVVRTERFR
jgi:Flp pilus assembly protein TadG